MQTVFPNETLKTLNVMVSIDYNSGLFGNARVNKTDTLGLLKIGDLEISLWVVGKTLIFSSSSTKANILTQQLLNDEVAKSNNVCGCSLDEIEIFSFVKGLFIIQSSFHQIMNPTHLEKLMFRTTRQET